MTRTLSDPQLDCLLASLSENRFLPCPPDELKFCGDGDFRAIGAEFLGNFVRLGGLRDSERVLDIGCGIGRMAVPLTQYLRGGATYDGVDVVADGTVWCSANITPVYPAFRFRHLDYRHRLYNPAGADSTVRAPLPFADGSFDFIVLVSVFTHLDSAEVTHYAREIARLLAPGGRCLATAFLMNTPASEALKAGSGRLAFRPGDPGPEFHADPEAPMAAVAFDEDFFLEKFMRHGLVRRNPALYGHWSGRASASFQDICVFGRS